MARRRTHANIPRKVLKSPGLPELGGSSSPYGGFARLDGTGLCRVTP